MLFVKIDILKYRTVIKFFVLDRFTPNKSHQKLTKVYCDFVPSMSVIKKWAAEFEYGRISLDDESRGGQPKTATILEISK